MGSSEMEMYKLLLARISFPLIDTSRAFFKLCELVSSENYSFSTIIDISQKISFIIWSSMITFVAFFCFISYISLEAIDIVYNKNYFNSIYNFVTVLILINVLSILILLPIIGTFILLRRHRLLIFFCITMVAIIASFLIYYLPHVRPREYNKALYFTEYLIHIEMMVAYFVLIIMVYWILYKDLILFVRGLKPRPNKKSLADFLPPHLRGEVLVMRALGHYVEITTEKGRAEIRMPFHQALERIQGEKGTRVHRSYWIKNSIMCSIEKQGNRFFAPTCYGAIPVSAAIAKKITLLSSDNNTNDSL